MLALTFPARDVVAGLRGRRRPFPRRRRPERREPVLPFEVLELRQPRASGSQGEGRAVGVGVLVRDPPPRLVLRLRHLNRGKRGVDRVHRGSGRRGEHEKPRDDGRERGDHQQRVRGRGEGREPGVKAFPFVVVPAEDVEILPGHAPDALRCGGELLGRLPRALHLERGRHVLLELRVHRR